MEKSVGPEVGATRALGASARHLLESSGLTAAGFAVSSVFVSLFFYVTSHSIDKMAFYGIGQYSGLILVSLALVRFMPGASPRLLFRAGIVLTALFYVVLIALGRSVGGLALPLGLFNGAAIGTYWFGNNTLAFDVLNPSERNHFYGLTFGIMSAMNVVMPLSAGAVIARIGGEEGFRVVFALASIAFVAAWWTARKLGGAGGVGGVTLRESILIPFFKADWAAMWGAVALRSFYQVAQSLGIIVLVLLATHSIQAQGELASAVGLASAVASVMAGRLRAHRRALGMWAGAVGAVASTTLLFAGQEFAMLVVYGVLNGLLCPGLFVPLSSVVLDVMDDDPASGESRGAYVLSRELATNFGRLAGVGSLLVLLATMSTIDAVLVLLIFGSLLQIAVAWLATKERVSIRHARAPVDNVAAA